MGSSATVPEEQKYNLDTKDESIYLKSYPKSHFGLTITLKDDRKLGYMIYGEISNPLATIIFLPGSPGTRLSNFEPHNKINKAYGIRLIILDRPGIGLSSQHSNYTFKSYANDIKQLIETLKLESYHIIGYSAGGPFACAYSSLNSTDKKLKSCQLISSVGPCNTPNAYGQMTFTNKLGWFIVLNTNRSVINWACNMQTKSENDKPIKTLIEDFSRGKYDTEMMKNPNIIKAFLQSKYEIQATETQMNIGSNDKCTNRLLELYGLNWNIVFENIKSPFYIYNGTDDKGCVPNMAKFIFENVTGKDAPNVDKYNQDLKVNNVKTETKENNGMDNDMGKKKKTVVAVDVGDIDNENDMEEKENGFLKVDQEILDEFEKEWKQNEGLNVNNKQSELIWGKDKGHLWFFEQDVWRHVVFRVVFLEGKTRN